jgi:hypothetical protein
MSEKNTTPCMRLYSSSWGKTKYETFKLMPVSKDSPYLEMIYDASTKVLAVIGTFVKGSFTMMQKFDKDGNGVYTADFKKAIAKFGSVEKAFKAAESFGIDPYAKERVSIDGVNEYYLTKPSEIKEFIERMAENASTFDFKKYLDAPAIVDELPEQKEPTILSPEQIAAEGGKKLSVVQE